MKMIKWLNGKIINYYFNSIYGIRTFLPIIHSAQAYRDPNPNPSTHKWIASPRVHSTALCANLCLQSHSLTSHSVTFNQFLHKMFVGSTFTLPPPKWCERWLLNFQCIFQRRQFVVSHWRWSWSWNEVSRLSYIKSIRTTTINFENN